MIAPTGDEADDANPVISTCEDLNVFYGDFRAVKDVTLPVRQNEITALIGPSGCGKTTVLRCFNRMNDLIETARVEGTIEYHGVDLYGPRRSIRSRCVAASAWSSRSRIRSRSRSTTTSRSVRRSPDTRTTWTIWWRSRCAGPRSGTRSRTSSTSPRFSLSGGQQQRLCIARAIATNPDVLLMDEPCSALDPIATLRIEELMQELKKEYTIIIVTHNMQQAARVSDRTAFFTVDVGEEGQRTGRLVEHDETEPRSSPTLADQDRGLHLGPVRLGDVMTTLHPDHAHEQKGEIEIRHHFDDELDEIRRGLVQMGSLVVENTRRAGEVAVENRLDLVDAVRAGDQPVNDAVPDPRTTHVRDPGPPAACCVRSAIPDRRYPDPLRNRAIGRSRGQHREPSRRPERLPTTR